MFEDAIIRLENEPHEVNAFVKRHKEVLQLCHQALQLRSQLDFENDKLEHARRFVCESTEAFIRALPGSPQDALSTDNYEKLSGLKEHCENDHARLESQNNAIARLTHDLNDLECRLVSAEQCRCQAASAMTTCLELVSTDTVDTNDGRSTQQGKTITYGSDGSEHSAPTAVCESPVHQNSRGVMGLPTQYQPNIECALGGRIADAFPDTGACANFISKQYLEKRGLEITNPIGRFIKNAVGRSAKTIGALELPFSFKNETKVHMLEFNVLPNSHWDIVLGSPFLRSTKTLTHFAKRISRVLRTIPRLHINYIGGTQQCMVGYLDEEYVDAIPDTGSDALLMSKEYATLRKMSVDRSPEHIRLVEFADGSLGSTHGLVRNVQWKYGDDSGQCYLCDFYILDGLECDVLLSYEFLEDTNAFGQHHNSLLDIHNADSVDDVYNFYGITFRPDLVETLGTGWKKAKHKVKILLRGFKKAEPGLDAHGDQPPANVNANRIEHEISKFNWTAWQKKKRELLNLKEEMSATIDKLPQPEKQQKYADFLGRWEADWQAHMRLHPDRL